jgi:hypothetical protein
VSADPESKMRRQGLTEAENRSAGRSRVTGRMNEDEEGRGSVENELALRNGRPTSLEHHECIGCKPDPYLRRPGATRKCKGEKRPNLCELDRERSGS